MFHTHDRSSLTPPSPIAAAGVAVVSTVLLMGTTAKAAPASETAKAAPEPARHDASAPEEHASAPLRPNGFDFYLGVNTAIPTGKFARGGAPISDVTNLGILATLGVGYRFLRHLDLGLYIDGGVTPINSTGSLGEACDDDAVECDAALVRFGGEARYTFNPEQRVGVWAGVAVVKEYFAFTAKAKETEDLLVALTASGLAYTLRGGVNLRFPEHFKQGVDIFAGYSMGQFSDVEVTTVSGNAKADEKALHGFVLVGAAAVF